MTSAVRKFNTKIMETEQAVYNHTKDKSEEIAINGTSPFRRVYETVETENGQCYGRINCERYLAYCASLGLGRDHDYFEICFEIVNKTPIGPNGERNDYTFYTGISLA